MCRAGLLDGKATVYERPKAVLTYQLKVPIKFTPTETIGAILIKFYTYCLYNQRISILKNT